MATFSDAFSGRSACTLTITVAEVTPTSTQIANNTSNITISVKVTGNSSSYNFSDGSYSISVTGFITWSGPWQYDFRSNNTVTLLSTQTVAIPHNADGSKTITVSATATDGGADPLGTATIGASNVVLTNYVRLPSVASAPTLTRSSDGATVTCTSAVASSPVTVTNYDLRWSYDGATWTERVGIGTDRTDDIPSLTTTSTVYAQTRAISSEGTSPWSASASIVGIPTAPATITATRSGHDVTVVSGTSTGTGITGYSVQYSTDSGSTWSTAEAMTSQSYTYDNLPAGEHYLFRVYASNAIGNSATTTSASVFVPAGGKRWDGSTWATMTTAKRWDGTAWVGVESAKRWNGSAWVDLS